MTGMTKAEKLKHCAGCEDDFYNGKNQLGVDECWRLGKAKLAEKKKIGMADAPPWKHNPIKVLSCYHQKGYWFVDADREY